MKYLILSSLISISALSYAGELKCVLEENLNGELSAQAVVIPASDDPHGAISSFTLTKYPDYQGFVALSNGFTVNNLVNTKTDIGISTQSKSAADSFARLQVILGSNNGVIDTIVIQCGDVPVLL